MEEPGEPLAGAVERLRADNSRFLGCISRVHELNLTGDTRGALALIGSIKEEVLRHSDEVEGRALRFLSKTSKAETEESIKASQHHRWIAEYLNERFPMLEAMPSREAQKEIERFADSFREQCLEDERIAVGIACVISQLLDNVNVW